MLEAIALLLTFQLAGEVASHVLHLPLPGPVIGLAAFALLLAVRPNVLRRIRPTALTLLQHLSLLFVPAGVGVMVHAQRLADEGFAVIVAIVASTVLAIAATALTVQLLIRRSERDEPR